MWSARQCASRTSMRIDRRTPDAAGQQQRQQRWFMSSTSILRRPGTWACWMLYVAAERKRYPSHAERGQSTHRFCAKIHDNICATIRHYVAVACECKYWKINERRISKEFVVQITNPIAWSTCICKSPILGGWYILYKILMKKWKSMCVRVIHTPS